MKNIYWLVKSCIILWLLGLWFPVKAETSYWDGHSYSTSWYNSSESVYYIRSAADLCGLSYLLRPGNYKDFEGKEIILMTDINLNDYEWETLGRMDGVYYYAFNGTFNGNGKTISGLRITQVGNENGFVRSTGLFGVLFDDNAVIKNLVVEGNIDVSTTETVNIGGISGMSMALVYNCISRVNIRVNSSNATSPIIVGGIVGQANGSVRNCRTEGEIQVTQDAASGCRIGGIAGVSSTSDIGAGVTYCKSSMNLKVIGGEDADVGGISALIRENNSNNLYTGNIDVRGTHMAYTGGIVSLMASEVRNCLMLGSFSGYGDYYYSGAIIPTNATSDTVIENSYYKEGLRDPSGFGIAISEAELRSGEILPGFDPAVWSFAYGEYPDLYFEFEEPIEEPEVEYIELMDSLVLNIGNTWQLSAIFHPANSLYFSTWSWSSSDESVATISPNGLVSAVGVGVAIVTITASNNVSTSCVVTVQSATSNENIEANESLSVVGGDGEIIINSTMPQNIYVYSVNGKLVKNCGSLVGTIRIPVSRGIYIVRTEKNEIVKIQI